MVLKFKPKANLKIILKESKTTKLIKESKSRTGISQVEVMLLHRNKQEILIYYDNKKIYAKKHCFWLCCTFSGSS